MPRYNIVNDDAKLLATEDVFDRACCLARELSKSPEIERAEVRQNTKSGRVLSAYKSGREVFYTYSGGKEF